MKPRPFRIVFGLSLLLFIPTLLGCSRHAVREESFVLPPKETPPPGPATFRGSSPPVVYAPYAKPEPLTPDRRGKVFRFAEEMRPDEREVWFVLVLLNRDEHWTVVVYYTPDEVKGRLRKGRYAYYNSFMEGFRASPLLTPPEPPGRQQAQARYVQVIDDAAKGKDFDYVGRIAEMPFDPSDRISAADDADAQPLSDEELIAVIDLASDPTQIWVRGETPVNCVEVEGDRVRVSFGWLVGMLYGGGSYREVQRSGNRWILLPGNGLWVS